MELGHIRQRPVATHFVRAVRINRQELQSSLLCNVLSPALGPREEEALNLRKPIDEGGGIIPLGIDQSPRLQ